MIGIDPHKRTHTAVMVDAATAAQGPTLRVAADTAGLGRLLGWARQHAPDGRVWAVEDVRSMTALLERLLLAEGEAVVRVPPKMTGPSRRGDRRFGKSDPIDAAAVAAAALRQPDLPAARPGGVEQQAKLLVDRRDQLVGERTREINRLRAHLHILNPELAPRSLTTTIGLHAVADWLDGQPDSIRVVTCRELVDRVEQLSTRLDGYQQQIRTLVETAWPQLLTIYGCSHLTAAKLAGEIGPASRFTTDAKLAAHAGCAPLPATSGQNPPRHRLNRHGNRQLNAAVHRIAVVQARSPGTLGHRYVQRRLAEHKTKREALRALKRHLIRHIHRLLQNPVVTAA